MNCFQLNDLFVNLTEKKGYYGSHELNKEELEMVCSTYLSFCHLSHNKQEFWDNVSLMESDLEKSLTSRDKSLL